MYFRPRSDPRGALARAAVLLPLPLFILLTNVPPAGAQVPDAPCPDGRIADITIDNHSVFDLTDSPGGGRFVWAFELANALHVRTRPEVVQREILFRPGDCYDVEVLRDSERMLRTFEFLADADIFGVRLPSGDVQVVVDTQDEWSTRIEPRLRFDGGLEFEGMRLREDNLLGTGRHISLFLDREEEERVYGLSYATPHLFRSRWTMAFELGRGEVGRNHHQSIAYPFVGETGRWAFRQAVDRSNRYFEAFMPEGDGELALIRVPVRREQFEVGSAVRWGAARYRHTVFGAAVAGEWVDYPAPPEIFRSGGAELAPLVAMPSLQWTPVSSIRLMLLTGQRNVYFVRREGFDTLSGTEDVELGVEAEATFGPTLPVVSSDRDVAVGLGLFTAGEVHPELMLGAQFAFEGRRSYQTIEGLPEWHDVLAEIDTWAYLRPSPGSPHLYVASVTAVGGWHGRVPFQLTLGGDTGLRGYARHVDPGGRRVVGTLEHRWYLGAPFDLFDFGSVAFLDAGRIWAGHVPFGTNSPVRASIGAGIRAAFPPGSRQTFRVDIALPVTGSRPDGVALSIGVGQAIGRQVMRRDPQLMRSTRYGLTTAGFVRRARP